MSLRSPFAFLASFAVSFVTLPLASAAGDAKDSGAGVRAGTSTEAVAVVADRQGKAQLVENGRARPLALLDYLRPNAELKLGGGVVTVVYFATGTQYVLSGEGSVRIEADEPAASGNVKRTSNALRQGALAANARQEAAPAKTAAPQPIQPLSPANTRVFETRPVFAWKSPKAKPPYRFTLTDAHTQVVLEGQMKAARLELPPGFSLSEGERYSWRVEGKTAKGEALAGEATFDVATAAERAQVAQARPAPKAPFSERVIYAMILDGMGFRDEARKEWRKLAAERKGDIRLRVRANKEH